MMRKRVYIRYPVLLLMQDLLSVQFHFASIIFIQQTKDTQFNLLPFVMTTQCVTTFNKIIFFIDHYKFYCRISFDGMACSTSSLLMTFFLPIKNFISFVSLFFKALSTDNIVSVSTFFLMWKAYDVQNKYLSMLVIRSEYNYRRCTWVFFL